MHYLGLSFLCGFKNKIFINCFSEIHETSCDGRFILNINEKLTKGLNQFNYNSSNFAAGIY
jgi:hypothetical protein